MMDSLFRGQDVRLLAPLPIPERILFFFKMGLVFKDIGLSTLLAFAFWAPQLASAPFLALACVGLWAASLGLCMAIASAVILYTGHAAIASEGSAGLGPMAFSTAPAIALAVSLIATLLLKLLVEALLKPGFFDAALTAIGILVGVFLISLFYAYKIFNRRYYSILANFLDNDLIVLNAQYDFIDDAVRSRLLGKKSLLACLIYKDVTQFKRLHSLGFLVMATFAIVLGIVLYTSPEYAQRLMLPAVVIIPFLIIVKPWAGLVDDKLETGILDALAIPSELFKRAKILASLELMLPYALMLCGAIALALGLNQAYALALQWSLLSLGFFIISSLGLAILSVHKPKLSTPASLGLALVFAILIILY